MNTAFAKERNWLKKRRHKRSSRLKPGGLGVRKGAETRSVALPTASAPIAPRAIATFTTKSGGKASFLILATGSAPSRNAARKRRGTACVKSTSTRPTGHRRRPRQKRNPPLKRPLPLKRLPRLKSQLPPKRHPALRRHSARSEGRGPKLTLTVKSPGRESADHELTVVQSRAIGKSQLRAEADRLVPHCSADVLECGEPHLRLALGKASAHQRP